MADSSTSDKYVEAIQQIVAAWDAGKSFVRAAELADKIQSCADIPDGVPWSQDELDLIEKALRGYSVRPVSKPSKGWSIRHVDEKRWRTMDTLGMPDWTDDPAKALVCRLREHIDAYAADDPEDVRIVEVIW